MSQREKCFNNPYWEGCTRNQFPFLKWHNYPICLQCWFKTAVVRKLVEPIAKYYFLHGQYGRAARLRDKYVWSYRTKGIEPPEEEDNQE